MGFHYKKNEEEMSVVIHNSNKIVDGEFLVFHEAKRQGNLPCK